MRDWCWLLFGTRWRLRVRNLTHETFGLPYLTQWEHVDMNYPDLYLSNNHPIRGKHLYSMTVSYQDPSAMRDDNAFPEACNVSDQCILSSILVATIAHGITTHVHVQYVPLRLVRIKLCEHTANGNGNDSFFGTSHRMTDTHHAS